MQLTPWATEVGINQYVFHEIFRSASYCWTQFHGRFVFGRMFGNVWAGLVPTALSFEQYFLHKKENIYIGSKRVESAI